MTNHRLAVPVGRDAARMALEQRQAELTFEFPQQLRRRGLAHAQALGGTMQIAQVVQGDEQLQMAQL